MNRAACVLLCSSILAGCQLPDERAPLTPLPENSRPLSYAELLTRARRESEAALEAFYDSKWTNLEQDAVMLEQTARFLGKASDVPEKHKDTLPAVSTDLAGQAKDLQKAAQQKDVKLSIESLQRIILKVREMRLGD